MSLLRGPHCVNQLGEGLRIVHGHVGQDLPIELDTGVLQSVHEGRVAHAVLARGGADPRDPQPPELALAVAAVAVRVRPRVHDLFLGHPEPLAARAVVALGLLEDLAALLPRVDGAFHPGHRLLPQDPADHAGVAGSGLGHPFDPSPPPAALLAEEMIARGLAVQDLARPGDPEPLGRASVRLLLRHRYPWTACCSCCSGFSGFSCFLMGARTMTMLRPSSFGNWSTLASSARS